MERSVQSHTSQVISNQSIRSQLSSQSDLIEFKWYSNVKTCSNWCQRTFKHEISSPHHNHIQHRLHETSNNRSSLFRWIMMMDDVNKCQHVIETRSLKWQQQLIAWHQDKWRCIRVQRKVCHDDVIAGLIWIPFDCNKSQFHSTST